MTNKQRVVFLSGRKVNLRPLTRADVPIITRWINDPEIREFVSIAFPHTEKQEEEWLNKLDSDDKNIVLCIETKQGIPIGVIGIHQIEWVHRVATTGTLIGEKKYWGKGFGTDAKMTLLDYAFNVLNLRRICSEALAYNMRSLAYSLHCGYEIEGRKKKHFFKNGRYHDVIHLGLFRGKWLPIWKKWRATGRVR